MRRSLLSSFLAVSCWLCVDCRQQIPIDFSDVPPQLVLQAEWNTSDTLHDVFLSVSGWKNLKRPAEDAWLRCTVNGLPVAEPVRKRSGLSRQEQNFRDSAVFHFVVHAGLHPGDEVELEAGSGNLAVRAVNRVSEACRLWADTSSVRLFPVSSLPYWKGRRIDQFESRSYQVRLHVEDIPGEPTWFRALACGAGSGQLAKVCKRDEHGGLIGTDTVYVEVEWQESFDFSGDNPVFQSAQSSYSEVLEEESGIALGVKNECLIFSDELFTDGSWIFPWDGISTLSPSVTLGDDVLANDFGERSDFLWFRVGALNAQDYAYYKSVNAYLTASRSAFSEPVTVPGNIEGGLGAFTLMAESRLRIDLPNVHLGFFGQDWTDIYPPSAFKEEEEEF